MRRVAASIAKELWDEKNDGAGSFCRFFKLSDDIGIKAYKVRHADTAFKSYRFQSMAGELGPECWGFSERDGIIAFFTEVVIELAEVISNCNGDRNYWFDVLDDKLSGQKMPGTNKVIMCDIHPVNSGISRRTGKFVILDFGNFWSPQP